MGESRNESKEFNEFNQKVRRAISKMDNALNESMSKCVTGAWNAIVRRRIDMHSTMSTVPAMNIVRFLTVFSS